MTNLPNFLYHYTNIESLALILSNHTFRFTSLDQMDDLQEKETSDLKNVGQFCYVSSWTNDETESIPMWKMYSSLTSGVRIKLRANPFKQYENTPESMRKVVDIPVHGEPGSNGYFKSFIPVADMFQYGYICPSVWNHNILHKVEYTSDPKKLYPNISLFSENNYSIDLSLLGKYKNQYWNFQNEWRYILLFLPLNLNQRPDLVEAESLNMARRILLGHEKQPFPYYDLYLDDKAYSQMEITLSPRISSSSRLIAEALIEKYNPTATILESSLSGLI